MCKEKNDLKISLALYIRLEFRSNIATTKQKIIIQKYDKIEG